MVQNNFAKRFSLQIPEPLRLHQKQRRMSVRSFYWVMVNPMVIISSTLVRKVEIGMKLTGILTWLAVVIIPKWWYDFDPYLQNLIFELYMWDIQLVLFWDILD